ncbi:MAG: HAD family hydrolase [Victivallales bacterium]|jgi:putative hydrolase of the HAD superfamily
MGNQKYFALDIGNVCLRIHTERCLDALGYPADTAVPMEFYAACDKLEKGVISTGEWLKVFSKVTGGRFTETELASAYNLILGDEIPGMYEFLAEITKLGCRAIFFSDSSDLHINHVYRHLPLAVFVSGGIFSFRTGYKKPESGMYEAFEKTYGKPCFYTDDRADNIEAGLKCGWPSHRFVSVELMREEFFRTF